MMAFRGPDDAHARRLAEKLVVALTSALASADPESPVWRTAAEAVRKPLGSITGNIR